MKQTLSWIISLKIQCLEKVCYQTNSIVRNPNLSLLLWVQTFLIPRSLGEGAVLTCEIVVETGRHLRRHDGWDVPGIVGGDTLLQRLLGLNRATRLAHFADTVCWFWGRGVRERRGQSSNRAVNHAAFVLSRIKSPHPEFHTGFFFLGVENVDACNGCMRTSIQPLGFCRNSGHT